MILPAVTEKAGNDIGHRTVLLVSQAGGCDRRAIAAGTRCFRFRVQGMSGSKSITWWALYCCGSGWKGHKHCPDRLSDEPGPVNNEVDLVVVEHFLPKWLGTLPVPHHISTAQPLCQSCCKPPTFLHVKPEKCMLARRMLPPTQCCRVAAQTMLVLQVMPGTGLRVRNR